MHSIVSHNYGKRRHNSCTEVKKAMVFEEDEFFDADIPFDDELDFEDDDERDEEIDTDDISDFM